MSRPLPRLLVLLALGAGSLQLAACGDDKDAAAEKTATAETASPQEQAGCEKAEAPGPKPAGDLANPKTKLDPAKTYVAAVSTNCGAFEITLDAKRAPRTGGSFAYLAGKKYYDGLTFHGIVAGFVIQGGDPKGDGSGGPGYSVVEAPPRDLVYEKGVVAMAKTQLEEPGTSGSQFFVVTGEDAQLPPQYALLGRVTKGQEVVDLIGVAPTTADEQPSEPIVIRSVAVRAG